MAPLGSVAAIMLLLAGYRQTAPQICLQVCTIFKVPIALVSLVEKERQWFKSVVGLQVSAGSAPSPQNVKHRQLFLQAAAYVVAASSA